MMIHPEVQPACPILPESPEREAEDQRIVSEDSFEMLRPYLREIGPLETLTSGQEVALARAIDDHTREMRREILGIPLAGRLVVERWCELRSEGRSTATLGALSPDRRGPDASARMDEALRPVALLLDCRDKLHGLCDGRPSRAKRARIDREMQRALLAVDLSPSILDEILVRLREREALLEAAGTPRDGFSPGLEHEIGLPVPQFRERMDRVRRAESQLLAVRNELTRRNLKLVIKVAKEFRRMGVALPDLVQEGSLGLLRAVGKFDHRRGFKFSTYAVWWIRQAMVRAIQKHSRTVRLPSHVYDRAMRFRRIERRLSIELCRAPTREEFARELEIGEDQVDVLMRADQKAASLDAPVKEAEGDSLGDFLEDPDALDPLEELHKARIRRTIDSLFDRLHSRERDVLSWRFGLDGDRGLTLQETADRLGLSRERVRQIQARAIRRLRTRSVFAADPDLPAASPRLLPD